MPGVASGAAERAHLEHPALLYESATHFLDYMVPYVSRAVEGNEFVFVAAKGDKVAALREALGPVDGDVVLTDTEEWYPHPARRLRAFHELVSEKVQFGASAIWLAGEPVWPSGPPEFVSEWQRYESVLNAVLASYPVTLVCLYDAAGLDESLLEGARHTHPVVEGCGPSDGYEAPEDLLRRLNPPLAPPPPDAAKLSNVGDLREIRRFVEEEATRAGAPEDRVMDLLVAANEAVTNAFVHGRGPADVSVWPSDTRVICQVDDRGNASIHPLAGYLPPTDELESGRGLWVARQLVDLLQVVSAPSGTAVRLHVLR